MEILLRQGKTTLGRKTNGRYVLTARCLNKSVEIDGAKLAAEAYLLALKAERQFSSPLDRKVCRDH